MRSKLPVRALLTGMACACLGRCTLDRQLEPATTIDRPRVLVFSKTAGFRHDSIPAGIAAVGELGSLHGFDIDATEDSSTFADASLAGYRVIIFMNTSGDILDTAQQQAFQRFVKSGGGFVGIHAASDTEHDWPWYGRLVGATFAGHPEIQDAAVDIVDRDHLSTRHLPRRWQRRDEWYNFREQPAASIHVLAVLDEGSYQGGTMGGDHPIAWCHELDGGRSWYTAGGHTIESFREPMFRDHLLGGIQWAGKFGPAQLD